MNRKTTLKELWLVSYPLIVTNACIVVMQFADRVFLSWYSPAALAACMPGGSLSFTLTALFMGIASYTGVFVAQYHGQKKRANISVSLWQGVIISLISGLLIAAATPLGLFLIDIFRHAPEVSVLEKQYFAILNIFAGLIILNSALASFFIGRGQTRAPMFVSMAGNLINIILAYALIFGKLGAPEWGIAGAAVGVVIANFSMVLMYAALVFTEKNRKQYKVTRLMGFYKPAFMRLVRYGVPNGFGFFMDVLSFSMFVFMVGHLDMLSLAASNIVLVMQSLSFMPILGLGLGVQVVVGRYMGMKRQDQVIEVVKNACKLGYGYAGVLCVLFFAVPHFFINFFLPPGSPDGAAITALALPLMKIVSVFIIADCTYLIFGEAIRGAGDTKFHMIIMIVCAWFIMIPGAYYIVYRLQKDVTVVWYWLTFYAAATGVLMFARFLQGRWKKIDITA